MRHMSGTEGTRTAYRFFVQKPGGRDHLEDLDVDRELILKWNL
jgi:hypothetical protein